MDLYTTLDVTDWNTACKVDEHREMATVLRLRRHDWLVTSKYITSPLTYSSFPSDLAFGRSFDSTATGKPSRIMEEVEAPVMVFGLFHYVPWVAHFFKHVPFMVAHKAKFDAYLHQLVEERKAMRDARPDCFSHFLDPYMEVPEKERTDQMQKNLIGDGMCNFPAFWQRNRTNRFLICSSDATCNCRKRADCSRGCGYSLQPCQATRLAATIT